MLFPSNAGIQAIPITKTIQAKNIVMRRILTLFTIIGSLFLTVSLHAATAKSSVTLGWTPSSSQNIAGYMVYYGTSSGNYISAVPVSNVTNVTINGLQVGTKYYFAATSRDSSGNQSAYSPEISDVVFPPATAQPVVKQFSFNFSGTSGSSYVVQASTDLVNWVAIQTNAAPFTFVDSNVQQYSRRFFRTVPASK